MPRRSPSEKGSLASNLVPGDTNGTSDVFVHDRVTGATERVSVGNRGRQSTGADSGGVLDFTVWELDKRAGKIDPAQVIVIWETPTFPDYQWTVRGDVDKTYGAGFKEKLRAALLAIDDKAILDQFARSKFIPAKNSDYDPIEEVGKVTNLLN